MWWWENNMVFIFGLVIAAVVVLIALIVVLSRDDDLTPSSKERLVALVGKFEAATTDGDLQLSQDDIGLVYLWLMWAQDKVSASSTLGGF